MHIHLVFVVSVLAVSASVVSSAIVHHRLIDDYLHNNEMLCVVIDKQERSVVYYKKQPSPMFNSHPTDYEDVSKMLHKLLKDFIK